MQNISYLCTLITDNGKYDKLIAQCIEIAKYSLLDTMSETKKLLIENYVIFSYIFSS